MPSKKISKKHQLFIEHYIITMNATKAYQAVYEEANYNTARVQGCKLRRQLQDEINQALEQIKKPPIEETINFLTQVMRGEAEGKISVKDRIEASKELLNFYSDKEKSLEGGMDININIV